MKRLKLPAPPSREKTIDGRYKVVRKIGEGATGTVYEGEQIAVGRRVAIKILHKSYLSNTNYKERFSREAKAIARLSHTNCITLYDFGFSDEYESLYMVMEHVDGKDLFDIIQEGPVPFRQALKIGIQVADAVAHAHKHGILHRDLKPENVLVTRSGEVKVLDFGLARMLDLFSADAGRRLTADGAVFGTPAYMSPEQCSGEMNVTVHSDIYSLGVLLFQLFQGELPFDATDVVQVLMQHARETAPPITAPIPAQLKRLVAMMLEKDKTKRPATATEVADTMRTVLIGLAAEDGAFLPDVSQEISRSLLARESADFPAAKRQTTEGSLPNVVHDDEPATLVEPTEPGAVPVSLRELVGSSFAGKWDVESELHRGPQSAVFSAVDAAGERVALKVLGGEEPTEPVAPEAFDSRMGAVEKLNHPNIVGVERYGHDLGSGRSFVVTKFVEGDDVATLVEQGRASTELALVVARDIATALAHAHDKGVVHGSILPRNVLLQPREDGVVRARLTDFGLDEEIPVAYRPPEVLNGTAIADAASDIYSLGVVLYEVLSGHPPFERRSETRLARAIMDGKATPLAEFIREVPTALSELIADMMSVDPSRRPRPSAIQSRVDALVQTQALKQFRVEHVGPAADPMAAWKLRRRVQPPVADDELPGRSKSRPDPAARQDTLLPPTPRTPVWMFVVVFLVIVVTLLWFALA